MLRDIQRHPLLILYLLLSLAHLTVEQLQMETAILLTKPLLMPILALWLWRVSRESAGSVRTFLLLGLVFSCGGDTLLMLVEYGPQQAQFFLLGLGSFLVAQLCYLVALVRFPWLPEGVVARHPWLTLLFLGYWYWILTTLWPGIPAGMRIPVAVYALAIVSMALMALNLSGRASPAVFSGFFLGVCLFVLSDSLIAFNKFGAPFPYARLSIMLTYLAAQLLIVWNGRQLVLEGANKNAAP